MGILFIITFITVDRRGPAVRPGRRRSPLGPRGRARHRHPARRAVRVHADPHQPRDCHRRLPAVAAAQRGPLAQLRRRAGRRVHVHPRRAPRHAGRRHAAPAGAGADPDSLVGLAQSFVAVNRWTFVLGPGCVVGIGNGVILGWLMYRSGLLPRRLLAVRAHRRPARHDPGGGRSCWASSSGARRCRRSRRSPK